MGTPVADRRGMESTEALVTDVEVHSDPERVDWETLKQDLADDDFDNGRTAAELRTSFLNSHSVVFGDHEGRTIATARLLADGVCNAYLVDVWTRSEHRRRGVGTVLVRNLLDSVPGHHVALFTEAYPEFYEALGFREERIGMSLVVGEWLNRLSR
jgi:GNAT superfamily N-acetyltransferase